MCPRFVMNEERRNRAATPRPWATTQIHERPSPPRANRNPSEDIQERAPRQCAATTRLRPTSPRRFQVRQGVNSLAGAGLRARGHEARGCLAYCSPLPGPRRASAYGEDRFHTPLRGSAGIGPGRKPSKAVPASLLNPSLYPNKEMDTVGERKLRLLRCAVKLRAR
jgi:hypothetical protein